MGCGYVGLIVSSWLTLSREGWASAAGGAHPREAVRRLVDGLTGVSVCADLGGVLKGSQIGLHGFGCFWGVELSGDSGGLRSVRRRV
nr:MAG TPA: Peptide methionine sulfoxide reductase [Caudoviricetes sp.]